MAEFDLGRLAAEDEITQLLFAYCTGIDTGRLDDTAKLFANGTWYLNPDSPLSGAERSRPFSMTASSSTTASRRRATS